MRAALGGDGRWTGGEHWATDGLKLWTCPERRRAPERAAAEEWTRAHAGLNEQTGIFLHTWVTDGLRDPVGKAPGCAAGGTERRLQSAMQPYRPRAVGRCWH